MSHNSAEGLCTSHGWPAQLSTISVFYKQRNNFFFPVTSYALPTVLLRVPLSVVTGIIFTALTYYVVGFAPDVGRWDSGAASLAEPDKVCCSSGQHYEIGLCHIVKGLVVESTRGFLFKGPCYCMGDALLGSCPIEPLVPWTGGTAAECVQLAQVV